jgi:hypothetical protein
MEINQGYGTMHGQPSRSVIDCVIVTYKLDIFVNCNWVDTLIKGDPFWHEMENENRGLECKDINP